MVTDRDSREDVAQALVRIGEQRIAIEDDAALDACSPPEFVFHGPYDEINIVRSDGTGRLAEGWVHGGTRGFLRKLGV
jgi:hypothetical protein